jgi:hypothetical protein
VNVTSKVQLARQFLAHRGFYSVEENEAVQMFAEWLDARQSDTALPVVVPQSILDNVEFGE